MNFLNFLEGADYEELLEYAEDLKASIKEHKKHYVAKLQYLRSEIAQIQALSLTTEG